MNGWGEILEFIQSVLALIGSYLAGLVQLLEMLPSAIQMVNNAVASMPAPISVFAFAMVCVSLTYLIIGRS